jgi:methionyl-tRNA formyltransferase
MSGSRRPRALFFGTPELAVPTLRTLIELADVRLVIAQPDRPSGRGMKLTPPPTKVVAHAAGIAVQQPTKVRTPEFAELLRGVQADIAIVIAYGRILPRAVLDATRLGSVNVHASLLPKYRGAAPIQWSIVRGDTETGVSLMQMDEGMDTGPVLAMARTPIGSDETGGELGTRLSLLGASLLKQEWSNLMRGALTPVPQDAARATVAPLLRREDGCVRWTDSAQQVHDRVRGLSPWPGAYTFIAGKRLKIHRTIVCGDGLSHPAGEVLHAHAQGLTVACGTGAVVVDEVQTEGGKRMKAAQWLAGQPLKPGMRFTEQEANE